MSHRAKLQKEILEVDKQSREFASLLSYAFLYNEYTVFHVDGSFSAHFAYAAQDVDSSTSTILDANANAVMQALGVLDDGWMIETNLISQEDAKYTDPGAFPDMVSALIDDDRRKRFMQADEFYASATYLSISYTPGDIIGKKLSNAMLDTDDNSSFIEREYNNFEHVINSFVTQWEKICFEGTIIRLGGDDLVTFLNRCITSSPQKLVAPKIGYFLNAYLSSDYFLSGLVPKIGNKWIKVLTLSDLPEYSYPAILDELNYLGFEYRWSSRYIATSKETATRHLKHIRVQWGNKAIGFIGTIKLAMGMNVRLDEMSAQYSEDTSVAIKENNEGIVRYGFFTSVVILMHEDQNILNDAATYFKKVIEGLNYKVRIEDFNSTEAYLGSLPGHGNYNCRKQIIDSVYVSHALPTSGVWQGSHYAPCPAPFYPPKSPALLYARTRGSRKFCFNLHVGDVGHFTVLGPTGSGKSTFLGLIGVQFRKYPNARIIVFDKDYSNRMWIKAINGSYMDVYRDTASGGATLAPFSGLIGLDENEPAFQAELQFIVEWLKDICTLQGLTVSPDQKDRLRDAVISLYHMDQKNPGNLILRFLSPQDRELFTVIKAYREGAVGKMLDGARDNFIDSEVLGLESGKLLSLGPSLYIPVVKLLFHKLEHMFRDKRPSLLILEEAWSFLRHEIFENMLEDWLLTLRKFNVAVGFISQNLEHVAASRISGTIKESCMTKVYLPNKSILDESIKQKYMDFGLNEQQIEILATATPKLDYYVTSKEGNRLFQLDLDALTLAFIDAGSKENWDKFQSIYDPKNRRWILDWLTYKRLPKWRDFISDYYFDSQGDGDLEENQLPPELLREAQKQGANSI